ncbi:MAG: universal stress protein [Thermoanaerobaculia bacterium]|nr:universal stress protein [Thermoanaerobaculia bacterium]
MKAARGRIRRILVATDFSETADSGLEWALEMARVHGAELLLVHGLMLPNQATDFLPSPPDYSEEIRAAARGRLERAADSARERGVVVSAELRLGIPSETVLEAAEESQADLVVIGTRGLTGIQHLLLGSTAERVVQRSVCPVLTVHPGDVDRHRPVRKIVLPTDFSAASDHAVETTLELLRPRLDDAELVLLHVYHLPFEYTAYGTVPTALDYFKDVEGSAQERLEELAEPLRGRGLTVHTSAREGYPPEVIVEAAEELEADLLALGTHGRSGLAHLLLGSTAERVVQRAPCPVLTVRRPRD